MMISTLRFATVEMTKRQKRELFPPSYFIYPLKNSYPTAESVEIFVRARASGIVKCTTRTRRFPESRR